MWDDDPIDDVPDCGFDDDDDPENEWVLNCGLEGCCMPGYHFRYECHTPEMIEAYNAECEAESSPDPTPAGREP
jgi:hypothetical protein